MTLILFLLSFTILLLSIVAFIHYNKKTTSRDYFAAVIGVIFVFNFTYTGSKGVEINDKLSLKELQTPVKLVSCIYIDTTITQQKLYDYLLETRCPHPEIVYCQAIHESGNFTSPVFLTKHNLFGMNPSNVRQTTGGDDTDSYKVYKGGWRESVIDMVIWGLCNNTQKMSDDEYYYYIGKIYAKDPAYVFKLKGVYKKTNFKELKR